MIKTSIRFHIKVSIAFLCLGFFFINFSYLDDVSRQFVAFSCFGMSIVLSSLENLKDIIAGKLKSYFIGLAILIFTIILSGFIEPVGEYGSKKYNYFLFVIFLGFISFPPLLKNKRGVELFSTYLFYISVIFCFIAIFFANAEGGRRSEIGLNPAILARIAGISAIYASCELYFKGFSFKNIFFVLLSAGAVFFTGTKTPMPVYLFAFFFIASKGLSLKFKIKYFFLLVLTVSTLLILLIYAAPKAFSDRILDPDGLSYESQTIEGNRFDLYITSIEAIPEVPLGAGFGGFTKFHSYILVPHNIIFEIGIELGIVCLIFFLIWIFKILNIIRKTRFKNQYSMFLAVLFLYFLISAQFGGELTIQNLLLYILGSYFYNYFTDEHNEIIQPKFLPIKKVIK